MQAPMMHLFKTPGAFYLYDANKNAILRLTQNVYEILKTIDNVYEYIQNDISHSNEYKVIKNIFEKGFLSNDSINEIYNSENDVIEYNLSRKLWLLTLQVTQQCNLRCNYCVYSGNYEHRQHANKKMEFPLAKKCIDFLISNSKDSNRIALGFYGGEPLLEFNLIKKCIEYIEYKGEGKEIIYNITTNGTLINDEIIEYFIKYNVNIAISIDGPSSVHDANRKFANGSCGTFDKIMENIERIQEKYPEYLSNVSISTVLDPKSDFGCTNEFFVNFNTLKESKMSVSIINDKYAKNKIVSNDTFYNKLNYEYFKLFLSKLGYLDEKYVSKLVYEYYSHTKNVYERLKPTEGIKRRMHPTGPCIPGVTRLFVNVNGSFYPCEKVSECSKIMNIGHIDYGFNIDKVKNLLNIGKVTENICKCCWAFRLCNLCAESIDSVSGVSANKRSSCCSNVRSVAEGKLKDICMLKEMDVNFECDNNIICKIS